MTRSWYWRLLLYLFLTCGTEKVCAQSDPSENEVKAVFIFNFTRFIDWPEQTFQSPESPLVIGVMGNDALWGDLQSVIAGERAGNRPISLQQITSVTQIPRNCHILFIGYSDPDVNRKILDNLPSRSILTVSDSPNFLRWGGMVRFYRERERVRLEINSALPKKSGIHISSKLLGVAKIY